MFTWSCFRSIWASVSLLRCLRVAHHRTNRPNLDSKGSCRYLRIHQNAIHLWPRKCDTTTEDFATEPQRSRCNALICQRYQIGSSKLRFFYLFHGLRVSTISFRRGESRSCPYRSLPRLSGGHWTPATLRS